MNLTPVISQTLYSFFSKFGVNENGVVYANLCTCVDIILYIAAFLLPAFFIFRYTEKTNCTLGFNFIFPRKYILLGITAIGCISAAGNVTNLVKLLFNKIGIGFRSYSPDTPNDFWGLVLLFISSALVPAIVEEILFRKVVLEKLIPFGKSFAVILTALLFSLMHTNISQFLYAFTGGLFLGLLAVKSGSVIPAVILHFSNNCLSLIYILISEFSAGKADSAILVFDVLLGIFGIISLHFIIKKNKLFFENYTFNPSIPQTINVFLLGYIVYCLFLSARWIYFI